MEDGIRSKILQMDDECQLKLQDTMQKIVNDSNGGMICIIIKRNKKSMNFSCSCFILFLILLYY